MKDIINDLKTELKQAEKYMLEGDCTMYETKVAYQAYIDGIRFALKKLKNASYAKPSIIVDEFSLVKGNELTTFAEYLSETNRIEVEIYTPI